MAITSVGYAGTVGDAQWAQMIPRVGGSLFGVDTFASFAVAIAPGTRAIQVAAGRAWASGILDTSNAIEPKTLAAAPSGTRWDLVVLRRNWATKVSTIEVIQGGSNQELPARQNTPGTLVDQPLALCRVDAGQAAVQAVIDLRCMPGDGGLIAFHDLVRSYLNRIGTVVRIGSTVWTRTIDGTGSAIWISSSGAIERFEGRFRRSDDQLVLNQGQTLMKWMSITANTAGATAAAGAAGIVLQLPAGLWLCTVTLKCAVQANNWSQLIITTAGGTLLAADEGEFQTPPGYFEMGATRLVHGAGQISIGVFTQSNNAGAMREDGFVRAVRIG